MDSSKRILFFYSDSCDCCSEIKNRIDNECKLQCFAYNLSDNKANKYEAEKYSVFNVPAILLLEDEVITKNAVGSKDCNTFIDLFLK